MRALFLLGLASLVGCSDNFQKDDGTDPGTDTGDTDTNTDSDTDTDTDTDTDSDTDTDTDTDTEPPDPQTTDDDGDGLSEDDGDCDDTDRNVSPDADEVPYNGVDDDCSSATRDDDVDGDGYDRADDCDDGNASVSPSDSEVAGNGVDDDCDGQKDERFDVATVDATTDAGYTSAVGVDSAGNVHVAYYDSTNMSLNYGAATSGGVWSLDGAIVDYDRAASTGDYIDAVVDAADRFQVAYTYADSSVVELDYIFNDGSWSDEYVVHGSAMSGSGATSSYDVGYWVSIDVDADNLPTFAYYDAENFKPVVADILTPTWTLLGVDAFYVDGDYNYQYEVFGTECMDGVFTSVAVDSEGFDQVAFYDDCSLAQEAQFSKWDLGFDSVVYSETIADDGWFTSIAITSTDVTCVALYAAGTADLKYGCRDDAAEDWTLTTVDSAGDVGSWAQLAFDSADQPWIAYYDATNGDLKLATLEGGSWEVLRVDSAGDVGYAPSLAIGPDDRAHVTYYDVTNGALKYAVGG